MKAGDPASKKLSGTYRADRHGSIAVIPTALQLSTPVPPAYLPKDALAVWVENLPRVIAAGANDLDSDIFAHYCVLEARLRADVLSGREFKITVLVELRRTGELLGIAGVKSRLAHVGQPEQASGKPSPFTVRRR